MKKKHWIIVASVVVVLAAIALAYQFHAPTRSWVNRNLVERFQDRTDRPKSVAEMEVRKKQEKKDLEQRFEKEKEAKLKEIDRLKAQKAGLEKQLKQVRSP